ncbi:MAG: hypothetical protein OEW16_06710 [Gammaproteobacteria bacterium]|nr:hypothetical protein [Gammaproteobacteria bacterium]
MTFVKTFVMYSMCNSTVVRAGAAGVLACLTFVASAQTAESATCSIADRLQGNLELHQVGSYGGTSELGAAIELDDSGHDVKKLDVLVNLPGKAIVLVLSAYDPVVWNVAWTPDTRIVGAVVSGYHGQAILGISKSIPLYMRTNLDSWHDKKNGTHPGCPYFYTYSEDSNNPTAAESIRRITGRSVTRFIQAPRSGVALVGEAMPSSLSGLVSSPDFRIEDFVLTRKASEVPAGRRGLDELIKRGFLRQASPKDMQSFEKSGVAGILRGLPAYVVLKPVTMPDGLYGANSVTILVPEGVPIPSGPRGHNRFFQYGQSTCEGPGC